MYITHLVPLNLPTIICGYRKEKEHGKCKGGEEERAYFWARFNKVWSRNLEWDCRSIMDPSDGVARSKRGILFFVIGIQFWSKAKPKSCVVM